jgi:hypothetical protein
LIHVNRDIARLCDRHRLGDVSFGLYDGSS